MKFSYSWLKGLTSMKYVLPTVVLAIACFGVGVLVFMNDRSVEQGAILATQSQATETVESAGAGSLKLRCDAFPGNADNGLMNVSLSNSGTFSGISFVIPSGWTYKQDAEDGSVSIMSVERPHGEVRLLCVSTLSMLPNYDEAQYGSLEKFVMSSDKPFFGETKINCENGQAFFMIASEFETSMLAMLEYPDGSVCQASFADTGVYFESGFRQGAYPLVDPMRIPDWQKVFLGSISLK